jgi:methylphosphotriester-DNA--protein-cysteine methyltransferase
VYIFKCKCDGNNGKCENVFEFKFTDTVYVHDYHDDLKNAGWFVMPMQGQGIFCPSCKSQIVGF